MSKYRVRGILYAVVQRFGDERREEGRVFEGPAVLLVLFLVVRSLTFRVAIACGPAHALVRRCSTPYREALENLPAQRACTKVFVVHFTAEAALVLHGALEPPFFCNVPFLVLSDVPIVSVDGHFSQMWEARVS